MTKILAFDEAIKQSNGQERTLLIGNGFSIAHFDYKTLLEKSGCFVSSSRRMAHVAFKAEGPGQTKRAASCSVGNRPSGVS